jgi:hypothetical protein
MVDISREALAPGSRLTWNDVWLGIYLVYLGRGVPLGKIIRLSFRPLQGARRSASQAFFPRQPMTLDADDR